MRGFFLTLVFAFLAGTAAYFGTRTIVLQSKLDKTVAIRAQPTSGVGTATPTSTLASENSGSATPTSSPVVAPEIAVKDRLSQPSQTDIVAAGDTLSAIAAKHGLTYGRLAEANGLSEPFPLKIGQVLIIPDIDKTTGALSIAFSFDTAQAQKEQVAAKTGNSGWRLDPTATAVAEVVGAFGLTRTDDYRLLTKDDTAGTAVVLASRLTGSSVSSYEILLRQPVNRGADGIWVIERVTQKK